MSNKSKVMKTNRILLRFATLYVSCDVINFAKEHLQRLEQNKHAPIKGHYDELRQVLVTLAKSPKYGSHFTGRALDILEN